MTLAELETVPVIGAIEA